MDDGRGTKMKAVWLEDNQISLRDIPQPRKRDEALIRIRKAGICSTDLELVKGYYPYTGVLGHEFVGEVVEADDDSWLGQRVVGEINVVCNQCEQCLHGRSSESSSLLCLLLQLSHFWFGGLSSASKLKMHLTCRASRALTLFRLLKIHLHLRVMKT